MKEDWVVVESSQHPADEKNEYPSTYFLMERQKPDPALNQSQA